MRMHVAPRLVTRLRGAIARASAAIDGTSIAHPRIPTLPARGDRRPC